MALLSMRIVDADYYSHDPIAKLEVCYSEFGQTKVYRVPVIRIFGSTTQGQKTCLHIHGVFPYFYVPVPNDIKDFTRFCKQFASSLDFSIQVALGKAVSKQQQFVYMAETVKKIPFYGYCHEEKDFLKVSLYNPGLVKKCSELLLNGSVLNRIFQPYETHIPYILQFFIDYNLHGMNLIHLSDVKFRQPIPQETSNFVTNVRSPPPFGSSLSLSPITQSNYDVFNQFSVPSNLMLPPDIAKQSTCSLEVDAFQSNIMNRQLIKESLGKNPGLNALWEDEKERRRENQMSSVIEIPISQDRDRYKLTNSEEMHIQQLKAVIEERLKLNQLENLDTSRSLLQEDVDLPWSEQLSSSLDRNLVDILVGMADEEEINTPLSETTLINNGLHDDKVDTEEDEDIESLIMSQHINQDNEMLSSSLVNIQPEETGQQKTTLNESLLIENNSNEEEGDSWSETFIGQIPQLDGQVDFEDNSMLCLKQKSLYCRCSKNENSNASKSVCLSQFTVPQLDGSSDLIGSSSDEFKPIQKKKKKKKKKKLSFNKSVRLNCDVSEVSTIDAVSCNKSLSGSKKTCCLCSTTLDRSMTVPCSCSNTALKTMKRSSSITTPASINIDSCSSSITPESINMNSSSIDRNTKTRKKIKLSGDLFSCNITSRKKYPKRTRSVSVEHVRTDNVNKETLQVNSEPNIEIKPFQIILNDILKDRRELEIKKCKSMVKEYKSTAKEYKKLNVSVVSSDRTYNDSLNVLSFGSPNKETFNISQISLPLNSPTANINSSDIDVVMESPLEGNNILNVEDQLKDVASDLKPCFSNLCCNTEQDESEIISDSLEDVQMKNTDFTKVERIAKLQLKNSSLNVSKQFGLENSFQNVYKLSGISNKNTNAFQYEVKNNAESDNIKKNQLLLSNVENGLVSNIQASGITNNIDVSLLKTPDKACKDCESMPLNGSSSSHSVSLLSPLLFSDNEQRSKKQESLFTFSISKQITSCSEEDSYYIVITPQLKCPSRQSVLDSLAKYNLSGVNYQQVFFGNEQDVGSINSVFNAQHVAAGREKVSTLPDCITKLSASRALKYFQQKQLIELGDTPDLSGSVELYDMVYGSKTIITPCKKPPHPLLVQSWYEAKCKPLNNSSKSIPLKDSHSDKQQNKHEHTVLNNKSLSEGIIGYTELDSFVSQTLSPSHNVQETVKKCSNLLFSPIQLSSNFNNSLITPTSYRKKSILSHSTPTVPIHSSNVASTQKDSKKKGSTKSKKRKITSKRFKTELTFQQPQPKLNTSDIEGVTLNNSYGFNITQQDLKDAKSLHVKQYLTIISVELHINTRRDLKPDPSIDSIEAIFYHISSDTNEKQTGIFYFDSLNQNDSKIKRDIFSRAGIGSLDVNCSKSEKDMLVIFASFVQQLDPDIILGYEVQMLSWGYLIERAAVLEINMCKKLSRIPDKEKQIKVVTDSEKEEFSYGQLITMSITGRIILNVWRVMRSEVTLQKYSFENVTYHVLHQRIPFYSFRSLSDWWLKDNQRWRVIIYYIRRCQGNIDLLDQIDFVDRTSELARIFGILFYAVISRGSQFRVESMMLRIAKPMNYIPVSPSVNQRARMPAPECIPLVMEPESGFYIDPVIVLDFRSLYPSIIIGYNYCYSTCLGRVHLFSNKEQFNFGTTSMDLPISVLKDVSNRGIHISPNGVGFVTPEVKRGILPRMLEEILNTRIMVKGAMKSAKDNKAVFKMLDSRQLGLKLIANVTYGYTSANYSGRMPCIEIGDSVVRKGRETLERAIDLVNSTEKWNAKVVYGDTDSLFVLLKGASKARSFAVAKEIVDEVTALNPKPIKLKFEKVYQPCVLLSKKRYFGYMYESLEQKEPKFDAKGIETVRRDNCPAVRKIMEKSIRILFQTKNVSLVKSYVQKQFMKIMEGKVILKDFVFAKEYRGMSAYKPGACVPALILARKMLKSDRRSEPRVGERVQYVVVHGSPGLPLIQLVRRPFDVMNDNGLRLNGIYYVTKQICPSLNRIFSLVGVNVEKWFNELPKITRVQEREQVGDKKGTISQYFSSNHCPICERLTNQRLCINCRSNPQEAAIILSSRMRSTERKFIHLSKLCQHCSGSREQETGCISLDCPIFYKLSNVRKDISYCDVLRTLNEELSFCQ